MQQRKRKHATAVQATSTGVGIASTTEVGWTHRAWRNPRQFPEPTVSLPFSPFSHPFHHAHCLPTFRAISFQSLLSSFPDQALRLLLRASAFPSLLSPRFCVLYLPVPPPLSFPLGLTSHCHATSPSLGILQPFLDPCPPGSVWVSFEISSTRTCSLNSQTCPNVDTMTSPERVMRFPSKLLMLGCFSLEPFWSASLRHNSIAENLSNARLRLCSAWQETHIFSWNHHTRTRSCRCPNGHTHQGADRVRWYSVSASRPPSGNAEHSTHSGAASSHAHARELRCRHRVRHDVRCLHVTRDNAKQ